MDGYGVLGVWLDEPISNVSSDGDESEYEEICGSVGSDKVEIGCVPIRKTYHINPYHFLQYSTFVAFPLAVLVGFVNPDIGG